MPSRRGTEKPQMSASRTPDDEVPACQRDGQVDRDRRLAHTALARGHRENPRRHGKVRGESAVVLRPAARLVHHRTSLGGVHLLEADPDLAHPRQGLDEVLDVRTQLVCEAGSRRWSGRPRPRPRPSASTVTAAPCRDRRSCRPELGVDHGPQGVADLVLGAGCAGRRPLAMSPVGSGGHEGGFYLRGAEFAARHVGTVTRGTAPVTWARPRRRVHRERPYPPGRPATEQNRRRKAGERQ